MTPFDEMTQNNHTLRAFVIMANLWEVRIREEALIAQMGQD